MISFLNYSPCEYNQSVALVAVIFGIFWYIVYNVYVLWDINDFRKGHKEITVIPPSISQTYYMIEVRWLFQMFMWNSIFALLCIGQNVLYLIVCLLFSLMTSNPSVNSGSKYYIPHMIGAIGAIILATLGLGISFGLWYMVIVSACLSILCVLFLRKSPSFIYYLEHTTLITLFFGFVIHIISCIIQ